MMKMRICTLLFGICFLFSSICFDATAYAVSGEITAAPMDQEELSSQLTSCKTRIKSTPKAVSVRFRRSKYKLKIGQKKRINITLRPSIAKEKPIYDSENPEIADFTYGNTLQAKQAGTTYITATLSNGRKARCKIVVKKKKKMEPPNKNDMS